MAKGLRAVKQTGDITSSNIGDLLYTSEATSPIIYKKETGSFTLDASGANTFYIPHDIGYPPITLFYTNPTISIVNGPVFGSYPMPTSWGLADNTLVFVSSYSNNIRIDAQSNSSFAGKVFRYVCFIYVEPPKMSNGLKISKNSGNISFIKEEELYVDTDTPIFKLFKSGNGVITMAGINGESKTAIILHNLGYIPFFLVSADRIPGGARRICTNGESTNFALSTGASAIVTSATAATITLTMSGFGGTPQAGNYGYSYFIYYDELGRV